MFVSAEELSSNPKLLLKTYLLPAWMNKLVVSVISLLSPGFMFEALQYLDDGYVSLCHENMTFIRFVVCLSTRPFFFVMFCHQLFMLLYLYFRNIRNRSDRTLATKDLYECEAPQTFLPAASV